MIIFLSLASFRNVDLICRIFSWATFYPSCIFCVWLKAKDPEEEMTNQINEKVEGTDVTKNGSKGE
jgi:hypothetical protein